MGSYHIGHQILAAISNILHCHPWGKVYWALLSGTGFHFSFSIREVPHFPDPISGQPLTQHSHFLSFVPGWPFISQPALNLTYFPNITMKGVMPDHSMGPPLASPLPAHCSTSSGLTPSCHSCSSHWQVSPPTEPFLAFLNGPALLQTPFFFGYVSVRRHRPPFPSLLSPVLSVLLSLPQALPSL